MTTIIPIAETNNRVMTATIVHAQDHDRHCRTVAIFNICKKIIVEQTSYTKTKE